MTDLGRKVKSYRQKNRLTQKEFGENIGINQWHVSSIESGEVNGKKGAMSVIRARSFFRLLETNRQAPTKHQVVEYIQSPRKHRYSKRVDKKVTVDPLSLKIVSELEYKLMFIFWLLVSGFVITIAFIVLK